VGATVQLPETLCAEALDFISYLRSRHPIASPPVSQPGMLAELDAFFATHQRDLSHFRFDREEAHERYPRV
jgi:hypothetical protein